MKRSTLLLSSLLVPFVLSSQSVDTPCFVNSGMLNIGGDGKHSALYVCGGVQMVDDNAGEVRVEQDGRMVLEGSYIQDSHGTVYPVDPATGYTTGKGVVSFAGETSDKRITTSEVSVYQRATSYVAFPSVEIATGKNIVVIPEMGIDMDSLLVVPGKQGKLYLQSSTNASRQVYEASLRFPFRTGETDNASTQQRKAPVGRIVVEKDITAYRSENNRSDCLMFPYATPYAGTQLSGYYAGNWIHKPSSDGNHHTHFPYGDKPDGAGGITTDQYVVDPYETFIPGQAYLVFPRFMNDFDRIQGSPALQITGAGNPDISAYKTNYFSFDGNVYKLPSYEEQLHLQPIFDATVSERRDSTVNILIGNSYTSAIDINKVVSMAAASDQDLRFNRYLYVYVPGSGYQPYDMGTGGGPAVWTNTDIPAMGAFMLRLAIKNPERNDRILINRSFQTHGSSASNLRGSTVHDEVLFTLYSESNPYFFDLAAIGMRSNATEKQDAIDMEKYKSDKTDSPQLYSLTSDNKSLSSNSVPFTAERVRLCMKVNYSPGNYRLEASRQESMNTEALLLEDRLTGKYTDLYTSSTYTFESKETDPTDRFVIHFLRVSTEISDNSVSALQCSFSKGELVVRNAGSLDDGSVLKVSDVQGRTLYTFTLSPQSEQYFGLELNPGIYIAGITGKRNLTIKFKK